MTNPRSRADTTDRILSVCAIIVAVSAVLVAVFEVRTEREFQEISVLPYIYQYDSNRDGAYHRFVHNLETGPALVRSFEIRVDGELVGSWPAAVDALTGENGPMTVTTLRSGFLLPPDQPLDLLRLPLESIGERFYAEVRAERLSTRICYCSLYDACWISTDAATEPEAVAACPGEAGSEAAEGGAGA